MSSPLSIHRVIFFLFSLCHKMKNACVHNFFVVPLFLKGLSSNLVQWLITERLSYFLVKNYFFDLQHTQYF